MTGELSYDPWSRFCLPLVNDMTGFSLSFTLSMVLNKEKNINVHYMTSKSSFEFRKKLTQYEDGGKKIHVYVHVATGHLTASDLMT